MDIQTKRLYIRDLHWDDLMAMHAFKSDAVVIRYTDFGAETLAETRAWLAKCIYHNNIEPRIAHNCAIVYAQTAETLGWIGQYDFSNVMILATQPCHQDRKRVHQHA